MYRRFRDQGRQTPEGLKYVSSWVTPDLSTCYQVMETDEPRLLEKWMDLWRDLVDFQVVPVISSAKAYEKVAPRL